MSRFRFLVVVLGLFAAGCGSDNDVAPSAVAPNRLVFGAQLSALNEVPALVAGNAELGARGNVTLTMNLTRNASGAITANTVDVVATLTGFPNGSSLSASHIHIGGPTVAGAVVIPLNPSAGEVTMPNGSGSYVRSFQVVDSAQIDATNQVIANPAGFYFNVHTATNPGGAARGQLALVP
ncbi:MAG: CHRD domain-containing protein [Acidobacteriota bacterium]